MKLRFLIALMLSTLIIVTTGIGEDSAKYWYDKAVEYSSNNYSYNRDYSYLALKCINKSLSLNNSDPAAWTRKGIIWDVMGKLNESLDCYDKAIELNRSYLLAWENKGNELFGIAQESFFSWDIYMHGEEEQQKEIQNRSYNESLICYDKVLDISPLDVRAWMKKGFVLDELGQHDEAKYCYKAAMKIRPEEAELIWNQTDYIFESGYLTLYAEISSGYIFANRSINQARENGENRTFDKKKEWMN